MRGFFGASSPQPVEQRVAPQPTELYENVYFEIPSGMIEKLLANLFAGEYFIEGSYRQTQGHYPQVGGAFTLDV